MSDEPEPASGLRCFFDELEMNLQTRRLAFLVLRCSNYCEAVLSLSGEVAINLQAIC